MFGTDSIPGRIDLAGTSASSHDKTLYFPREKNMLLTGKSSYFLKEYRTGFFGKFLAPIKGWGLTTAFSNFSLGRCVCCHCSVAKSTTEHQASLSFTISWESVCLSAANSNPFDYPDDFLSWATKVIYNQRSLTCRHSG